MRQAEPGANAPGGAWSQFARQSLEPIRQAEPGANSLRTRSINRGGSPLGNRHAPPLRASKKTIVIARSPKGDVAIP